MIDLKTLYEQTTMYCNRIDMFISKDNKYIVEVFQQPNTPINVFAYWHNTTTQPLTLHSIAYQIDDTISETKENTSC